MRYRCIALAGVASLVCGTAAGVTSTLPDFLEGGLGGGGGGVSRENTGGVAPSVPSEELSSILSDIRAAIEADPVESETVERSLARLELLISSRRQPSEADADLRDKYNNWVFEYRKEVFDAHHVSSLVIMCVVHLLLLAGFAASAVELWGSYSSRIRAEKESSSEVVLRFTELSIKSARIGMIILGVSVLCYFVYLKFVYPVTVIGAVASGEQ